MDFFGSIMDTVRFGIFCTSIRFILAFINLGLCLCMQNDAASRGKGDGVNQGGKVCAVKCILWVHQSGAFSGNLCGDLRFCIGLPIKLTCNLAQQVYDPLLIWLLA